MHINIRMVRTSICIFSYSGTKEYSEMLLDTLQRPCLQHKESISAWFDFRNQQLKQFSMEHCNAVLLNVQDAVYKYFNRKVVSEIKKAEVQESEQQVSSSPIVAEESEDVYYQLVELHSKRCCTIGINGYVVVLLTREARFVLKSQY